MACITTVYVVHISRRCINCRVNTNWRSSQACHISTDTSGNILYEHLEQNTPITYNIPMIRRYSSLPSIESPPWQNHCQYSLSEPCIIVMTAPRAKCRQLMPSYLNLFLQCPSLAIPNHLALVNLLFPRSGKGIGI